ncbi:GAF domain-containing protein [Streptomyces sp. WAC05374]|uniref:GAF domain-containing protein n=1 Tax=Streptomyces sp. WAC05374 TaxID=2487420 RepID=UPI000F888345|nr:GAF domain-containing protein [Streptomyces sp. WAC05374]RST01467.1 GAF domain-containing protein [Streptomyces sp. WAC05374]TDF45870.1 GAF domain-containing protein [Streptomyces sp. WAC05374]TDF48120.1 GAF domain-containing protein [Streptomyces sp. WAC05374]TDF52865.1 GAF domain-containing protein [Streptomyces sp. WAC05374]
MTYDPTGHLLLTPVDREAPLRVQRLRQLGIGERPDPDFDAFADKLAQVTGAPYSMVNFIDENQQFFAGLHTPNGTQSAEQLNATAAAGGGVSRYMARDHGYCPHVVVRRKALVLEDVCDYPRFAGNPVVDEIGIRSYLGAPLIDRTGTALGTICVVDTEPRPWGRPGLETIKSLAAELVEQIHLREDSRRL